jgi:phytoene/squalene synthetase
MQRFGFSSGVINFARDIKNDLELGVLFFSMASFTLPF